MNTPYTFADGYGRWHAYIPEHFGSGAIIAARSLIRDELLERSQECRLHALNKYVVRSVEWAHVQDVTGFRHYVEYPLDN